jgi:hypothetical protein
MTNDELLKATLLASILDPLERRMTGRFPRAKALLLLLFFAGAGAFIYKQTGFGVFAVFGGFALLFSPMFLSRPAGRIPVGHFYNDPNGRIYPGNYYGHKR